MKVILICPGERQGVAYLAGTGPIVTVPILGSNLLGYWLQECASKKVTEADLIVTDRPEQVRQVLEVIDCWGVKVNLIAELQEPTVEEAIAKYGTDQHRNAAGEPMVFAMDTLPGLSDVRLTASYAEWFRGTAAWMARVATMKRVGVREVRPGVWVSRLAQVSATAVLNGPCWLGENVWVGPGAVIGPEAVLEDRVVADSSTRITRSIVGVDTFVGSLTDLTDSIAWGSTLINWRTGSHTVVPDAFLLSPLTQGHRATGGKKVGQWLAETVLPVMMRPLHYLGNWAKR